MNNNNIQHTPYANFIPVFIYELWAEAMQLILCEHSTSLFENGTTCNQEFKLILFDETGEKCLRLRNSTAALGYKISTPKAAYENAIK